MNSTTGTAEDRTQIPIDALNGVGFLCSECATTLGGQWPKDHVATCHVGECGVCHKTKNLANVGDWDWPDGQSRGMRD